MNQETPEIKEAPAPKKKNKIGPVMIMIAVALLVIWRIQHTPEELESRLIADHETELPQTKSAKVFVQSFLKKLKKKQYAASYKYFSQKYKEEYSEYSHIDFMREMLIKYGAIKGFVDNLPGLGSTVYKRGAFFDFLGKKLSQKYLIKHQKKTLLAQFNLIFEGNNLKIDEFVLMPIEQIKDKKLRAKLKKLKITLK